MTEKYHFIGVGGIGMSGLARIVLSRKALVSGSDLVISETHQGLIERGAVVHVGHSSDYIQSDMSVVYSTDIKENNPEYQAALDLKCQLLHRSQMLQKLMEGKKGLIVAGTHGKTTTSALLTWVLHEAGQHPSYAVGGMIPQLESNAEHGQGDYFVAEACESDGSFCHYHPYGAIITNIDLDHMDYYLTEKRLIDAFAQVISHVDSKDHLFWCGEDERLQKINSELCGTSYGFNEQCQLRGSHFRQEGWFIHFDASFNGQTYRNITIPLTGRHNALNALAVFGLALALGISEEKIRRGLSSFGGVLRRCEKKGEVQGVLFLDDYGHHPTEIQATLNAVRHAIGERRLIVIYQPHRYSRTRDCAGCYGSVFNDADLVFVNEIYGAREAPIVGVSHDIILHEVQQGLKERCQFLPRAQSAIRLVEILRPHDVVLTLGAGDVTTLSGEILSLLRKQSIKRLKVGVIRGGASVEHEISLKSSEHILASLNPLYYEVHKFYISCEGRWQLEELEEKECYPQQQLLSPDVMTALMACDILFPILHGTNGEDGTIQGFFETISKPYVGCDYRSAAIAMDKAITKKLLMYAGVLTSPFISFQHDDWQKNADRVKQEIVEKLRYPLFVKPVHLGSSIGIHKVLNEKELCEAVEDAFRFDTALLVENGIEGRELEVAVLGNHDIRVFPPGEIFTHGEVYDYESKYSSQGMKTTPQAVLSQEIIDKAMSTAKQAYQAINCIGMARVDMFLDQEGRCWLNEINPIPGFTKTSLYPQMCAAHGMDGFSLVDRLIILGLHHHRSIKKLELQASC